MSNQQQLEAPNENNKPWAKYYLDTLTVKTLNVTSSQSIASLEVKNNLLVDGYTNSHSNQDNCGTIFLTTAYPGVAALPAGTNGADFTFSSSLGKLVISGDAGANTAAASTDGTTFAQLTTPFANPSIGWSPDLALFSGIDAFGTAVYTSPTAVNGTWVLGTPLPGSTFSGFPIWISAFQRFYSGAAGVPTQQMASSLNGSLYSLIPASRDTFDMAY